MLRNSSVLRLHSAACTLLCRGHIARARSAGAPVHRQRVKQPAARCCSALAESDAVSVPSSEQKATAFPDSPFAALGVDDRVLGRLGEVGAIEPTPVQCAAIPVLLAGRSAAIQSYTGSGKTLAFLLPTLSLAIQRAEAEHAQLATANRRQQQAAATLQALIIAPSRELAMQIVNVARALLPPAAHATVQQCIGGANMQRQVDALKGNKPIIVVGTPGRLSELSLAGKLLMHPTGVLVLDEVDQLLKPHFAEDMARLTEHCGKRRQGGRQTVIVSATLNSQVLRAAGGWCSKPECVFVRPDGSRMTQQELDEASKRSQAAAQQATSGSEAVQEGQPQAAPASAVIDLPPNLTHMCVETSRRHRVDTVRRCIHALDLQRALVFMNSQSPLQDTQGKMAARGFQVGVLHGDMPKAARQRELARFRAGEVRCLLVSDMAARGLDVPDCDGVVNLELPTGAEAYAHRAGRTGRAGRPGVVVSLVEPDTRFVVNKLQRRLKLSIPRADIREGKAVLAQPP